MQGFHIAEYYNVYSHWNKDLASLAGFIIFSYWIAQLIFSSPEPLGSVVSVKDR